MKLTVADIQEKKKNGDKIVMLTSYDFPTAMLEDENGVDIQLIGDSVGTNVLGYLDVSQVTVDDMLHHLKAVRRGARRSFVLCDMPFNSFVTNERALVTAQRFIQAGADGVKMEGEQEVISQVQHLTSNGISVCAHIGYTPQTDGKPAIQGKDFERAVELIETATRLQDAGACMMVLELIPEMLAGEITAVLDIPTIGIGAGRFCDGQVQVIYDILGMSKRIYRHAKAYGSTGKEISRIISEYKSEVKGGHFPSDSNRSVLPEDVYRQVKQWVDSNLKGKIRNV